MPSVVAICNLALAHIGVAEINSLTEATNQARQCNLLFVPARDAVLREFPWNFATKMTRLAQAPVSVPDWDYVYQYPSDCLRAIRIYEASATTTEFRVVLLDGGKAIVTNVANAYLEYTARVTDPALFDAQFIDAFSWKLAAELAAPLTGDPRLGQYAYQMYQQALRSAWASTANEQKVTPKQSRRYVEVRN